MQRPVLVRASLVFAVVLGGGGWLVRSLSPAPASAIERGPEVTPVVTPRADSGAAVVVAPTAARAQVVAGFHVQTVTGPVERRVAGVWTPVLANETISARDTLRTGAGGAAVLELQDGTTVWLWPESEVSADRLDAELARIAVAVGRMDLDVTRSAERQVEIVAPGGAAAVTRGAKMSIIVDGAQVMTVATREGEVDVIAASGRVRVPPGMQARARPGAPTVLEPIPRSLLLRVDWPAGALNAARATVRGHAPPGVLVSIGGARVSVSEDGTFSREVPLREGDNRVRVQAVDAVGHTAAQTSPNLHVDTHTQVVVQPGRWE